MVSTSVVDETPEVRSVPGNSYRATPQLKAYVVFRFSPMLAKRTGSIFPGPKEL